MQAQMYKIRKIQWIFTIPQVNTEILDRFFIIRGGDFFYKKRK